MTTLPIPQPTATSTRATLNQEQQLQSLTPEDLTCSLALAARLDVLLFAGSICRHCGHLADHGHATTCPFPDRDETRRPLDAALPGKPSAQLSPAAAHAVETITSIAIPTQQLGAVPMARCALRHWARHQDWKTHVPPTVHNHTAGELAITNSPS